MRFKTFIKAICLYYEADLLSIQPQIKMKESLVMSRCLMSHYESINEQVASHNDVTGVDSRLIPQVIHKLKRAIHHDVTCVGICDSFLKCAAMKWC